MSINLSTYSSIAAALIVRIDIDEYRSTPSGAYTSQVLRFSDWNQSLTVGGETFLGLGQFVGITSTTNELRTSNSNVTITVSGIPNSSIAEIVNSRIKGSPITVRRVIFNPVTKQILDIQGNPAGRFFGIVNNYTLDEEYDVASRTATNTIGLVCSSLTEVLGNKIAGRKTNTASHRSFYPNDPSMDRVSSLVGSNFNFGIPQQ
jgi:hypothetical protein